MMALNVIETYSEVAKGVRKRLVECAENYAILHLIVYVE